MKFRTFHKETAISAISDSRQNIELPSTSSKEYPRFPTVELPTPTIMATSLTEVLQQRHSERVFDASRPLTLLQCATLLFAAAGTPQTTDTVPHRTYPSGGALQPIEHYLIAYRVDSLTPGIYHYHSGTHSLSALPFAAIEDLHPAWESASPVRRPAAVLVLTALWGRSYAKYGDFCYRLALAEAGHSAQNALLAATALHTEACPIMGFDVDTIARALDISQDAEDPLYLVCFGA